MLLRNQMNAELATLKINAIDLDQYIIDRKEIEDKYEAISSTVWFDGIGYGLIMPDETHDQAYTYYATKKGYTGKMDAKLADKLN